MIRHCVFIHFRTEVSTSQRDALFDQIVALQSRLKGMVAVQLGKNVSPEAGMDKGFADGFMIDFSSSEHRDAYLIDAEHQAIGARLVESALGGAAGILVFDMEIPDQI